MISGDKLQHKSTRIVAGSLAVMLLGGACATERTATTSPDTSSTAEQTAPAASTSTTKQFTPIVGRVAHTENAQGVKEGVIPTRGAGETASDREETRPIIQDGATVQVLCHLVGRTIDLRIQSPGLGLSETSDWLKLQDTGFGPEFVPDVFVDTRVDTPVPKC